ncbi:hypothetical protein AU255_06715 [Methyloprofundus sedimenti]|uniref:Coiled coil domain-containing protein n=1 Tax=Methyloprofundus sedimenti TaxID=1420851 RepID=A0A1V8M7P4_9GAMM|nr:hypothetical protein [Methyloprofundus sedimenti]OQK17559.1 hypothetical protein AU255_06715 [Methyloprofundus sedimenti]
MTDKNAYVQKMHAKIDQVDAQIDLLQAKLLDSAADAQIEYQDQLETLKKHRTAARSKLSELEAASQDAWKDIQAGMESAWDTMNSAVSEAKKHFK